MDYIIYISVAIVFIVMISISAIFAFKVVFSRKETVASKKRKNGDVSLDEICEDFLELTNLGEVKVP